VLGHRGSLRVCSRIAVCACLASLPASARKTDLKIAPGPAEMTAEEKAISADAAAGTEHGVILLEETDRTESFTGCKTVYHLRAKILSNEGRSLADVAIPIVADDGELKDWWARTILPDGGVLELPRTKLEQQSMMKTSWGEVRAIKGALPGVVPGAVIDYGYVLEDSVLQRYVPVILQRGWLVRELRYRWHPAEGISSAYLVRQGEGRDIKVQSNAGEVVLEARNLMPVAEEPWMPPDKELRSSVVLYYMPAGTDSSFWNAEAKRIDRNLKSKVGNLDRIQEGMAAMNLPAGGDLGKRLAAAYDWIGANVKNASIATAEEMESLTAEEEEKGGFKPWNVRTVLDERKGTGRQIDMLFVAVARALGADANLILATDRSDGFWDQQLLSTDQFATTLVAVKLPPPSEAPLILADPGSGLPFGEIPWWTAGTRGFLATKEGGKSVQLTASDASRNVAATKLLLSFDEDNQALHAQWSTVHTGQKGLDERHHLRSLGTTGRAKGLDRDCGAGGSAEVTRAEASGLEDLSKPFRLECEADLSEMNVEDEIDVYSMSILGPWIRESLDLSAPARVHPVILSYMGSDQLEGELTSPTGFAPTEPPKPIELALPGATYSLKFDRTEGGYRFSRALTWKALMIRPAAYDELRKFLMDIRKADRTALEFRRKES